MPTQSLSRLDPEAIHHAVAPSGRWATVLRRLVVFGSAGALAAWTIDEMRLVLNVGGLTLLEIAVLVLFSINTVWIALPSFTALAGFLRLFLRRRPARSTDGVSLRSRTALLMPLYNEDPVRVGAALEAMGADVASLGEGRSFDIFILSDTTDGERALAERQMVWKLHEQLGARMAVYYRRRRRNVGHKAGNIHEFCTRWGSAYDHLLVLDADSLMDGRTIVELARRMEADPDAGVIQTVPRLFAARTVIGRIQQFAGAVYGPVLASGLAWWTRTEGNYYGHNAILRTRAFMRAAGLPALRGKPPLGGAILSHDFVEAALLRRAGWHVILADDLDGSYETSPPSLLDLSVRDRRWCQGNLQHTRLLFVRGLHWMSRLHLLTGIMTFLSSPLWLLFLVATLALGVQNEFAKPEYFTSGYSLFPIWPSLDPIRALRLFAITLAILLAPKVLGIVAHVLGARRLRWTSLAFPFSVVVEWLLSALLAPVMMLMHCGFVADVLTGKDGGWKPQRRSDNSLPWPEVAWRHRWHVALGLLLILAGRFVSWEMLAWLTPAIVGMVAAIPLSLVSGSVVIGRTLARLGLLATAAETEPPAIRVAMERAKQRYEDAVLQTPDLVTIASDPLTLRRHLAMIDVGQRPVVDSIDPVEATAEVKVRSASNLEAAVASLTPEEHAYVESAPRLLVMLSCLPRRYPPSRTAQGLLDASLENAQVRPVQ